MPLSPMQSKILAELDGEPPTPVQIRMILMEKGDTLAGLVRQWRERDPSLSPHVDEQVLSRVIHRRAPYVYQEVRELLAAYLGCEVSQVGREPAPKEEEATAGEQEEEAVAVAS